MKTNINIFWILVAFFALLTAVYTTWALISTDRVEWVGTVAIGLCAVLSAFIAFYLQLVNRSTGGLLPEDRLDADIDDGDPELGHFSPWSWWPVFLAGAVSLAFLGLAAGIWIMFYAVPLAMLGLVGWVYEYYRGNFGR
ncbi:MULTISPECIES: cytochrome c oxidase subunit 4 [unclassified Microcella]|uniref:cytochrome c oxidase subunit 4 n=1 Tax=unclassified Microcella TaxID=2630066 RepID=UPI0006FC0101|nr:MULTISPECIES: cytochrome c oxidase subunit 4 [unclassified Microcella]KQV25124.1 cytochrome c oxidase subunit IV [Yonghaparkia sp. Root332]KRF31406.1 cytochrome c oxidase subunit IV [Yonghaparkia sp. Soil809]